MDRNRRTFITGAALGATALAAPPSWAQTFPDKPVRIVVGFAAGGGTDFVARTVSDSLSKLWGQPVIVENKTGVSGMIAAEQVVRSAPDGYTLLVSPQTSIAVAPQMYSKPLYDPMKDLTPVTVIASSPLVLVAHPSFPASTFKEFVAHVRQNPGKISFASGGNGSSPHMTSELLNTQLGLKMIHVPYRGEQPALVDLIGNQVGVLFANIPSGMPHVKAGRLKALVTTGQTRSSLAPDIPTIAESGEADIATATWNALYGPAGMAPELVRKLHADVSKAMKEGETRKRLEASGNELVLNPPAQFAEFLAAEVKRWGGVIKRANIRVD
jgi:tripartite-type tricarboxylate transporter receptor subunit TctC